MRIVCLSDTHLHHSVPVPTGDVLIHAGDGSSSGLGARAWLEWLASHPHPHKIVIAGNHDLAFQREEGFAERQVPAGIIYLQDAGVEINGLRFWGSPWMPGRQDKAGAFYLPRNGDRLGAAWAQIPVGTDVLITHIPPQSVLDQTDSGESLGCSSLLRRVEVLRPRLHVFGHVHSAHGHRATMGTTFVNATICGGNRTPTNEPMVVGL